MPNNNTEAITHVVYEAGTSPAAYSYSSLSLSELYSVEDQIEVLRVFPFSEVPVLVSETPDGNEVQTLYALPNDTTSGSPFYLVDLPQNRVVFSPYASDYVWRNGPHHNRGSDINLPVHDYTRDKVIIRRKTYAGSARISWTVGTKVTATLLNAGSEQSLNLAQELRTAQLHPLEFNHWIGAADGLCPIDGNGVIPLSHISTELGGQGVLEINLSNNVLKELKNVTISSPLEGEILTWDTATGHWINAIPFSKNFDLDAAEHQQVITWNSSTEAWELDDFNVETLSNVNINASNLQNSSILFFRDSTSEWIESDVVLHGGVLTDDHVLTWNATTSKWEARVRPDVTYEVFDLSTTSIFSMVDVSGGANPVEGDVLAWFNNATYPNTWRDKSMDTWDTNNWWNGDNDITNPLEAGYTGGYQGALLWKFHKTGHVPFWDPRLRQKDYYGGVFSNPWGDGRGSFNTGPIFAGARRIEDGTIICNFETANQYDVVRWKKDSVIGNHWQLDSMNINHLHDVRARRYISPQASVTPDDGDYLSWSSTGDDYTSTPSWIVTPGPAVIPAGTATLVNTMFNFSTVTDQNDNTFSYDSGFIGADGGPLWLETYVVAHNKLRFYNWYLLSNGPCKARVRLYKCTYSNWTNPSNWAELTVNSGGNQNDGPKVLGWGQGNSNNLGPKKKRTASDFVMTSDYVDEGEIIICLLENFYNPTGTAATTLSLNMNWTIE